MFFIISKHEHRLRNNGHVLILYTSAIFTFILFFTFFVIGNYNLSIIVHIFIRLLACTVSALRIIRCLIILTYTVLFIQLSFENFKLIGISSFYISHLLARLSSILITNHKVRIFIYHRRIILNRPFIIPRLVTKQTAIEDSHHIVRFHIDNKIKVLDGTIVITYLGT